ncbi:MAG TPA: ABC transporter ATP-binding protein [Candidatus Limnocylindria bacterium]
MPVAPLSNPHTAGQAVRVEDATVRFPARDGSLVALDGCSLDAPPGSFTVVIGPNGCGKSTLLRLIAGLLRPDAGRVGIGPDAGSPPRAGDGRVGIAFQQPRLLPWLSTLDNVALPLALHGVAAEERNDIAREALARVGLADAAGMRPRELSGGMAQRAGLARALIGDPPVLLLDEPFSALDALSREAFDTELQALWLERPRTVILVTHSVPEAVRLADRIAVMTPRPGSVARVVEVDLPRPRPISLAGEARATELEAEVRNTLTSVHAPELAAWTASA